MSWFMRGVPLTDLDVKAATYLDVLNRRRLREPAGVVTALRQVIRNLRGETRGRNSLSDDTFDEETFAREAAGFGSRHFEHIYYVARLQVLYLWGDYDGALQAATRSAACLKSSPGMLHSAEHHFYTALLQSATGRAPRAVRGVQRRYGKWAALNEENFLARSQILAGEVARQQGRFADAAELHATAAAAAASFGQHHLVALASQLAASAFVSAGNAPDAARCHERAIEAWNAWGATAYAQQLSSTGLANK
jgi:tetratricopeptide (TPR) repeat protein